MIKKILFILIFAVALVAHTEDSKKLTAEQEKKLDEAVEEIHAEIEPLVREFSGKLESLTEYFQSDLKKQVDKYSVLVRKKQLPGLLAQISEDLRYQTPVISGRNGYDELNLCLDKFKKNLPKRYTDTIKYLEIIKSPKMTKEERQEIIKILRYYEAILKQLPGIISAKNFTFVTLDWSQESIEMKNLGLYRQLIKSLQLRSKFHLYEKDYQEAFDDALLSLALTDKLKELNGPLIHYLVAIACDSISSDTLSEVLKSRKLQSKQLLKLIQFLEKRKNGKEYFKNTYKSELRFIVDDLAGMDTKNVQMLKTQLYPSTIFMDEEQSAPFKKMDKNSLSHAVIIQNLEQLLVAIFKDVDTQPWTQQARERYAEKVKKQILIDRPQNKLSLILAQEIYRALDGTVEKYFHMQNNQRAQVLATAIQLFEKRHSKFPDDLNKLVKAGILKSIPLNIWTNKHFNVDWQKRFLSHKNPQNNYEVFMSF